jgi:hypothetical protein
MARYDVDVTLSFEVNDAEALRQAAWEVAADRREIEREGRDVYADIATATTELALSVLIGRSAELRDAMREVAAKVEGMSCAGQLVFGDGVRLAEA